VGSREGDWESESEERLGGRERAEQREIDGTERGLDLREVQFSGQSRWVGAEDAGRAGGHDSRQDFRWRLDVISGRSSYV